MEFSAEIQKWFTESKFELLTYQNKSFKKLKNLDEFRKLLETEISFWSNFNGHAKLTQIYAQFTNSQAHFQSASNTNDVNQIKSNLTTAVNYLAQTNPTKLIYSGTSEAKFIMECFKRNAQVAYGAYDMLTEQALDSPTNCYYMEGVWKTLNRRLSSSVLGEKVTESQQVLEDLLHKSADELTELHDKFYVTKQAVEDVYGEFTEKMESWKSEFEVTAESENDKKQQTLQELELRYQEKLRFDGPADYWNQLVSDYKNQGDNWRNWSIVTAAIVSAIFMAVLYYTPPSLVSQGEFTINSIRGTIILALIASLGIYLLKLFVKLAISAYHLSRDAKERYQLTHFYLSLINESSIKDDERNIVFQALFSRADTGLLKGDSSPTMPDGLTQQLIKLIGAK